MLVNVVGVGLAYTHTLVVRLVYLQNYHNIKSTLNKVTGSEYA